HGPEDLPVNQLDEHGHPSSIVEQVKVGIIKFDNGSRIIAFSSNPQAMAVYGGDVGLDEFAKHPNAKLLWETAHGRIALGHDLAIWSAHDGEDTLFNEFAQEARAACTSGLLVPAGPGCWRLAEPDRSRRGEEADSPGVPGGTSIPAGEFTEVGRVTPCAPPTDNPSIQNQNSNLENSGPST